MSGYFIGTVSLRSESSNAYQIGPRQSQIVWYTQVLIYNRNLPLWWGHPCEDHEAKRFPNAITIPTILFKFDNVYKRIGWIDK
jgi:hypothetical protein